LLYYSSFVLVIAEFCYIFGQNESDRKKSVSVLHVPAKDSFSRAEKRTQMKHR